MRALILDGNNRTAIEALQSLGRAGVRVDICAETAKSLAFRSRYAERRILQPSPAATEAFLAWLHALDAERGYTLVVASSEMSLLALRVLPENDPTRIKAVIPSNEAVDVALDKERTRTLAANLGIPVPESVLIESLASVPEAHDFPLVLKPIHSKVFQGNTVIMLAPVIVENERDRRRELHLLLRHAPVQQQAYVSGRGVGVEFLYESGRMAWHFAHERIHELPLKGGASTYRRSMRPSTDLLACSERLLNALRWHGVAMVEYKMKADGSFYLLEINPRLWGSLALAIDAGVNFPLGLLRLAEGRPPGPQPSYREYYFTRSLRDDMRWIRANWRARHRDPLLLTRPRLRSMLEYLRPLLGRESWDHFDVHDLRVIQRILRYIVIDQLPGKSPLQKIILGQRAIRNHRQHFSMSRANRGVVKKILFLCYGNICRSPFAACLAKATGDGYQIESGGFHETVDRRPPDNILCAARAMGFDLADFRSSRVTPQQIEAADLILVADLEVYSHVNREFPDALSRTTLLGLFSSRPALSIADPFRASERQTRRVLKQIELAVDGLFRWLNAGRVSGSSLRKREEKGGLADGW